MIKLGSKSEKPTGRTILFVCVENAGRSQMAEGFFNYKYAPKGYCAISAGLGQFLKSTPLRFAR